MKYKRLIPVILLKDGILVRSQNFKYHQAIGAPIPTIKRFSDWSVDEIILLEIGSSNNLDSRRDDQWHSIGKSNLSELVKASSKFCFAPLTVGGNVNKISHFQDLFEAGADKVVVNTSLFNKPDLVSKAVSIYGSQALVASLDCKTNSEGKTFVYTDKGRKKTEFSLSSAIEHALSLGVGEILISSIDNDGSAKGYDQNIISKLPNDLEVPIIINSGPKSSKDFVEALENKNIQAVAASNIFYFTEVSYPLVKKDLITYGYNLRNFNLASSVIRREGEYNSKKRDMLLKKRDPNSYVDKTLYEKGSQSKVIFCKKCLYPSLSATPMEFDEFGICMGCRMSEEKFEITQKDYAKRRLHLEQIVSSTSSKSDYDCIISVSGGKDSYYQAHFITKELGLKALLVTYNGNNYTEVGWRNLMRMKEVFECDHIIISPQVSLLKKLNKLAFITMGDMNWHNHVGLATAAPKLAVQFGIPLIFWGEHGPTDICGQFTTNDYPEMNYRERTEYDARSFDWPFFVGIDGITTEDMNPWKYPNDQKLFELGLRQLYLGNFIPWESNDHLELMIELYDFKISPEPFERTYRRGSNLDDMHENGVHDYLKYIKFGYGRCTDHATKDIRAGLLERSEAIERMKKMDHVKPKDLKRWLEYVSMSEEEFDRIADHFRDPRVWFWSDVDGWKRDEIE